MADAKRRESTEEEKKQPIHAHPRARIAAILFAAAFYCPFLAIIIWFIFQLARDLPISLPVILSLIGILIALFPFSIQLYGFVRKMPGASWQILFIRHSSKPVPISSHEFDAQYEFVVENRGSTHGVLKYIKIDFFENKRFTDWDPEQSIESYLNPPQGPMWRLRSLPLSPKSASYVYVALRIKEIDDIKHLEYKSLKPKGPPINLEEIKGTLFRFKFIFTKEAWQIFGNEQELHSPIFKIGDQSFQKPK